MVNAFLELTESLDQTNTRPHGARTGPRSHCLTPPPSASADAEVTVCLVRYGLIQLTVLSVLVEAADGFASPSVAAAAAMDTTTFPLPVIPVTVTV